MVKFLVKLLIFIIIWIILGSLYYFYVSTHPRKFISKETPTDYNLSYEDVTLKTSDNIKLKGWFIPSKKKTNSTIIVAHGYPFDKGNVLVFAEFLHEKYNLFYFDFRYFGESQGRFTSIGLHETKDLQAAIDYLKSKDQKNIGAIGFSLGASVTLMNENLNARVADSAYANLDMMIERVYRPLFFMKYPFIYLTKFYAKLFLKIDSSKVSPLKHVRKSTVPTLFIHGNKDDQIDVENSKLLFKEANKPKELWIIEDANHGQSYFIEKQEYEKRVLEFFEKYLKE